MTGALQYCGTERRRQRVAEATIDTGGGVLLNGIDYLEVVDRDAPSEALRQRLLTLAFLRNDGVLNAGVPLLDPDNFRIDGGTRINGIRVTDVAAGPVPHSLTLTVNAAGDYSPYRLSVRLGAVNDAIPPFLDPMLAALDFSFKAECPSAFDCAAPDDPGTPRPFGPPIDYLAKDYDSFRQLMLDRMAVSLPGWTERSPADLGVTLVEALAYAADRTSWFQDAVGTEAFFGRARLRQSVMRHARLLGYSASEGCNARVAVAVAAGLDVERGPLADPILPRGARLLTRPPDLIAPLATVQPRAPEIFEDLVGTGAITFETLHDLRSLRVARNAMLLHDWGDAACCLPAGATAAHLVGTRAALGLAKGDLILFEQLIPFGGEAGDPPDPAHRQLVRLSADPVDVEDAVMNEDLVYIEWHADDALAFPLNLAAGGAVARGNILLADEGRSVDYGLTPSQAAEDAIAVGDNLRTGLLPDDGPGALKRFRLRGETIVHAVTYDPAAAASEPARATLAPAGAPLAQVRIDGDGHVWRAAPDLLAADPFTSEFCIEASDQVHYARFGDGAGGRRPTDGAALTARIRHGGGRRGNIGADAIAHVVTSDGAGIASLRNPMPATGGRDREPVAAIRVAAPRHFRQLRRAVTPADYVTAAEAYGDVQRAYAERRWTGSWNTIFLAIDRRGGGAVDETFENALRGHLATYRLAGHDVEIVAPRFVPLDIRLFVCVCSDHYAGDVERDLLDIFSAKTMRDGRPGFFHPDFFSFGDNILLSPIIARAMQVAGVQWIGTRDGAGAVKGRFGRLDQPDLDFADDAEIPIAPNEVARLDNDPTYPDFGRIAFLMAGGR
ncbi:baseplate J/gp47 family protein [Sphingopyxis sp. QXT-31]|uniref:baseplate J/gp47 family protein n=1 Tax=Sphingopyxis sp. QXT-31 TaxID=1357916 RepID=UPI0009F82DE1|nr:baseplate J/gp47 family protein [Sphingopyxis sp. QXT-31]